MVDSTPAETQDTTAQVGCDCIKLTNDALAEHNTELGVTWEIDRKTGEVIERVGLEASLIEKKRGARPMRILAEHCPFCGNRYVAAAQQPAPEAGQ